MALTPEEELELKKLEAEEAGLSEAEEAELAALEAEETMDASADLVGEPTETGLQAAYEQAIPGYQQIGAAVGAGAEKLQDVGQYIGEKVFGMEADEPRPFLTAYRENLQKLKGMQERSEEAHPKAALFGKGTGVAATLPLLGKRAGLYGYTAAKSLSDSTKEEQEEVLSSLATDVGMTMGLDLATFGLGGTFRAMAPKTKEMSFKILEKVSGLSKRVKDGKISPEKARDAAAELMKNSPFFPSIRSFAKKVDTRLKGLQEGVKNVWDRADSLVQGQRVVDLRKLRDALIREENLAITKQANDVLKKVREARRYLNVKMRQDGNMVSPTEAWSMLKNYGRQAFQKTDRGLVTHEGYAIARSRLKEQVDGVIHEFVPELGKELNVINKQMHNLLNISKPLSKEAAKKSASLIPGQSEVFYGILGGPKGFSARMAVRAARNLMPGVAAKGLMNVGKVAPKIDQARRFGPFASEALSPMVEELKK